MTTLNRRQKHRNRTAVTTYLCNDTLEIFEGIIRITGSTVSSSELVQLAIMSLMGRVAEIYFFEKERTGKGGCSMGQLGKLVELELQAVQKLQGEQVDGNA